MTKDDIGKPSAENNQDGISEAGDSTSKEQPVLTTEDLEKMLGKPVIQAEITNLTAAGENYGSFMLAVDATLESGEKLALVAKMFPKNEFAQKLFQSPISMRKEIEMYVSVSPEFQKIQEECSIPLSERLHVLCECPGARLTLGDYDEDQLADKDSVLLLENLKLQGYKTADRLTGLDLKHTEFVLKHLARFHATAVAIKLRKPLVFQDKILKACTPFKKISRSREDEAKARNIFIEKLRKIPICEKHMDTISKLFNKAAEYKYSEHFSTPVEPFATILHSDFWTNNMMFKYDDETSQTDPVDFKMVDFQTFIYESPVPDIMFFLFTSTQTDILEEKLDDLLKLYHDSFSEWLELLGCDTRIFSFDRFLQEVNENAADCLAFIMSMLRPITLTNEEAKNFHKGPDFAKLELNDNCIKKLTNAVTIFANKGWLH